VVRENALKVYGEIIGIFCEDEEYISQKNMEHFKEHIPLISIGKR
jgi:hypothetical protein